MIMRNKKVLMILILFLVLISANFVLSYEIKTDEDGNKIIIDDEGKSIGSVLENVDVQVKDGKLSFLSHADKQIVEINGKSLSLNKGYELLLDIIGDEIELETIGKGSIKIDEQELFRIKDALIKIDENGIKYAKFDVTEDQKYFIAYKGKKYVFDMKKGGKLIFNPEGSVISGKDLILKLDNRVISDVDGKGVNIYLDGKDIDSITDVKNGIISISKDGSINALGKVIVDTQEINFVGLTDSTRLDLKVREGKEIVKITSSEDGVGENKAIARFTKKYLVGSLKKNEDFFKSVSGVDMIITRENGEYGLLITRNSAGLLGEIQKDQDYYAIISSRLELQAGNDALLDMNTEFGIVETDKHGTKTVLSPLKVHQLLGSNSETLKGILKSQIETNEVISLQRKAIQKIYEMGKGNSDKRFQTIDDITKSYESTLKLIDEMYSNEFQRNAVMNDFMLSNLEEIIDSSLIGYNNDYTNKFLEQKQIVEGYLQKVKDRIESNQLLNTNGDRRLLEQNLNKLYQSNRELSPQQVKNLYESEYRARIILERLSSSLDQNHEINSEALINSYKSLIDLEDSNIRFSGDKIVFDIDSDRFSTKKLNYGKKLLDIYRTDRRFTDAVRLTEKLKRDFSSYVKTVVDERYIDPNTELLTSGIEDKLERNLEMLNMAGYEKEVEALDGIKRIIDTEKRMTAISVTQGIINNIHAKEQKFDSALDAYKGYVDRLKKSDTGLLEMAFKGGFIRDLSGAFESAKKSSSFLSVENAKYMRGADSIQLLLSSGASEEIVSSWINGKMDSKTTEKFAKRLLISTDSATKNPVESPEFPGKESGTNNDIVEVNGEKYAVSRSEQDILIEQLNEFRGDAKRIYDSEDYGRDLKRILGDSEDFGDIAIDDDSQIMEDFNNRLMAAAASGGRYSSDENVDKLLRFIDDGLSPGTVAIGALTGGLGGTSFSSTTGLAGATNGVIENVLIDAATGGLLINTGLDPEKHPYISMGTGIGISILTGIPRTINALNKGKILASESYENFMRNMDDAELSRLGLTRNVGNELFDRKGNVIGDLTGLTKHLNKIEMNGKNVLQVINAKNKLQEYIGFRELVNPSSSVVMSQSEIARIRKGDYTSEEIGRILNAQDLLIKNGYVDDAKLLASKENADLLLFSHYSGNNPDGTINVFTKARPLMNKGFSKDAVKVLGDNYIIGHGSRVSRDMFSYRGELFENSGKMFDDERGLEDIIGFNPEDPIEAHVLPTDISTWQSVEKIRGAGSDWAYKAKSEYNVKSELTNRNLIDSLENILPDWNLKTNNAFGYKPIGEMRFHIDGYDDTFDYVLLNEVIEGNRFDKNDPLVNQIISKYGNELGDKIRTDTYIFQRMIGDDDLNQGGFILTDGGMKIIDMESTGESVDRYGDLWQNKFLKGLRDGSENGWSNNPVHNTLEFKEQLIARAREIQANKEKILVHYERALDKAGFDNYGYRIESVENNIDNLVNNINKEWDYLGSQDLNVITNRDARIKNEFLDQMGYGESNAARAPVYDYSDKVFREDMDSFEEVAGGVFMDDPEIVYAQIRGLESNQGKIIPKPEILDNTIRVNDEAISDGKYIWTLSEDADLSLGIRDEARDLLPHTAIAEGKGVFGAGEMIIKNGEIIEINAKSGHYVPFDNDLKINRQIQEKFRKDSIEAMKTYLYANGLTESQIDKIKFNLDYY